MANPVRYRIVFLLLYFLLICFLFFIPGSSLPKGGSWMDAIYFDKWVHAGIFAVLTFATAWTGNIFSTFVLFLIFLGSLSYGIIVELIQDYFIANRSFDWGDWIADGTGSLLGLVLWWWRRGKK